jgi:hypothetical protein
MTKNKISKTITNNAKLENNQQVGNLKHEYRNSKQYQMTKNKISKTITNNAKLENNQQVENSKHEYRNSKQYQMTKTKISKTNTNNAKLENKTSRRKKFEARISKFETISNDKN